MDDSTNLCLSCGLCCDGTVIGFVQLGREELPVLRELMDIENSDGDGCFLQPCKNYCDGCAIYSNRPKQCANFKCGLLESLERKEIDLAAALEAIAALKQNRIAIEKKLDELQLDLQSPSFYFKMLELNKLLQTNQADPSLAQSQSGLASELEQLDHLLSDKFGVSLY